MTRVKLGASLLSVWSGINLVLAVGILASMTLLARNAPSLGMLFTEAEVARLEPRALALVNALAVLLNACVASFCLLVLLVTWIALVARRQRWAFWSVAATTVFLQAFGYVCDAHLGHRNLVPNLVSTAILLAGLVLSNYSHH